MVLTPELQGCACARKVAAGTGLQLGAISSRERGGSKGAGESDLREGRCLPGC